MLDGSKPARNHGCLEGSGGGIISAAAATAPARRRPSAGCASCSRLCAKLAGGMASPSSSCGTALISARSCSGTRTAAVYVNLAPGESWQGRMDLRGGREKRGKGWGRWAAGVLEAQQGTAKVARLRRAGGCWIRTRGSPGVRVARSHLAWMAWHCGHKGQPEGGGCGKASQRRGLLSDKTTLATAA